MSRVLFVQTNCGSGNGISAYIREVTRRLQGAHDCHVVAYAGEDQRATLAAHYGVPVDNLLLMPTGAERELGRPARRLAAEVRARRPDVIHAHALRAATVVAAARVLHGMRVPGVYTNHGVRHRQLPQGPRRWMTLGVDALVSRMHAAVVCVTEADARMAPVNGACVLRTRIDVPALAPSRAGFEVIAVGPVGREKGSDRFAEIARRTRARAPDARFTWIGAGPAGDGAVAWAGRLARAQVLERMARASLYLFCSRIDTYPMALLEAYASGLPVLFSAECDVSAYAPSEMPRASLEQAAETIVGLLEAPAELARLSGCARAWFVQNAAGGDRFAADHAQLYESVARKG